MLLALFLQTALPVIHPALLLLLGAVLTALATWQWKRYDARLAAAKSKQESDNIWRQTRLDAEQALRDALKQETAERTRWQLENDADLERIAGILKDVNETQKLTATLAADSKHQSSELMRINDRVEGIGKQLNDFILSHVKH